MTHSAASATGLTANSVDLTRTDLKIMMRVTHGGPFDVWSTRGRDTIIPGAHGQVARNRKRDRLIIIAEGFIMGDGANEAAQRADIVATYASLHTLMEPTQAPYTLVYTDEAGGEWEIEARPVNILYSPDNLPTYREASAEWLAIDTDWVGPGS
jgi:hypothetical protein